MTDATPDDAVPEGPRAQLAAAEEAFRHGDYAQVRSLVDAALAGELSDDLRASARDLRRRVSLDPVQLAALGACLLLFLWIAWTYVISPCR